MNINFGVSEEDRKKYQAKLEKQRFDKNNKEFFEENNFWKHPVNAIRNGIRNYSGEINKNDLISTPTGSYSMGVVKANTNKSNRYNAQANNIGNVWGNIFNPTGGHKDGCKQYAYEVALNMGAKGIRGKWDGEKASGYSLQWKRKNGKIVQTTIDDYFRNGGGVTVTKDNTKGLKNGDIVWLNGGSHSGIAYQGTNGEWYLNENTVRNGKPIRQNTQKLFSFKSVQYGRPVYDRPQAIFNTPKAKQKEHTKPYTQAHYDNVLTNLYNNGFGGRKESGVPSEVADKFFVDYLNKHYNLDKKKASSIATNWAINYTNNRKQEFQNKSDLEISKNMQRDIDNFLKKPEIEQQQAINRYNELYETSQVKADNWLSRQFESGKDFETVANGFAQKFDLSNALSKKYITEYYQRYEQNHPQQGTDNALFDLFNKRQQIDKNFINRPINENVDIIYNALTNNQIQSVDKVTIASGLKKWVDIQKQINNKLTPEQKNILKQDVSNFEKNYGFNPGEAVGNYITSRDNAIKVQNYIFENISKFPENVLNPTNFKKLQKAFPNIENGKLYNALHNYQVYAKVNIAKDIQKNPAETFDRNFDFMGRHSLAILTELAKEINVVPNTINKVLPAGKKMNDWVTGERLNNWVKNNTNEALIESNIYDKGVADTLTAMMLYGLGGSLASSTSATVVKGTELANRGEQLASYGKLFRSFPTILNGLTMANTGRAVANVGNMIKYTTLGSTAINTGFNTFADIMSNDKVAQGFNNSYDKDNPLSWLGGMLTEKVMQKAQSNMINAKRGKDAINIAEGLNKLHIDHEHMNREDGVSWWDNFSKHPVKYLTDNVVGSFVLLAPELLGGGKNPGRLINAINAFRSSYGMEKSTKYLELLEQNGVDVGDIEQLQEALSNPNKYNDLKTKAGMRGIGVAIFDAISAGLAGKVFGIKPTGAMKNVLLRGGLEILTQAFLGGTGEAVGSLVIGEKPDYRDVIDEAFGEIVPGIYEGLTNYNSEVIEAGKEYAKGLSPEIKSLYAKIMYMKDSTKAQLYGLKFGDINHKDFTKEVNIKDADKYLGEDYTRKKLDSRIDELYRKVVESTATPEEIIECETLMTVKNKQDAMSKAIENNRNYTIKYNYDDKGNVESGVVVSQPTTVNNIIGFVDGDTIAFTDENQNVVKGKITKIDKEKGTVNFDTGENIYTNIPLTEVIRVKDDVVTPTTENSTFDSNGNLILKKDAVVKAKGEVVGTMRPYDISINKANQFRETPNGVVDNRLNNIKTLDDWNPKYAGSINVYFNEETKQLEVFNGHHRLQKLQELIYNAGKEALIKDGVENPTDEQIIKKGQEIAEQKGKNKINIIKDTISNSADANIAGALINLSNGTVTAWDMANFLRQGRNKEVVNSKILDYLKKEHSQKTSKYKDDKQLVNHIFDVLNINSNNKLNADMQNMLYLPDYLFENVKSNTMTIGGYTVDNDILGYLSEQEGASVGQAIKEKQDINLLEKLEANDGRLAKDLMSTLNDMRRDLRQKSLSLNDVKSIINEFVELMNTKTDEDEGEGLFSLGETDQVFRLRTLALSDVETIYRNVSSRLGALSGSTEFALKLGINYKEDKPRIDALQELLKSIIYDQVYAIRGNFTRPEFDKLKAIRDNLIIQLCKDEDYTKFIKNYAKEIAKFYNANIKGVTKTFKKLDKGTMVILNKLIDTEKEPDNPFKRKEDAFSFYKIRKELGLNKLKDKNGVELKVGDTVSVNGKIGKLVSFDANSVTINVDGGNLNISRENIDIEKYDGVTFEELKKFLTELQKSVGFKFTPEELKQISDYIAKIGYLPNLSLFSGVNNQKSLPAPNNKEFKGDKNSVLTYILSKLKPLTIEEIVKKNDELLGNNKPKYSTVDTYVEPEQHRITSTGRDIDLEIKGILSDNKTTEDDFIEQRTNELVEKYPISEQLAREAHRAYSLNDFTFWQNDAYKNSVKEMVKFAEEHKKTIEPEFHAQVDELVEKYAKKLSNWYDADNRNTGSVPSVMISGPANYPVKKHEQMLARGRTLREEYEKLKDYKDYILKVGKKSITTTEGLQEELNKLKHLLERLKELNKIFRKDGNLDSVDLSKETPEVQEDVRMYGMPIEQYYFNGIRDKISRLESKLKTRENADSEVSFEGGKIILNTEIDRLQILFDEKPSEEMISNLKHHGFKWSPKNQVWQRQLTRNAIHEAEKLFNVEIKTGYSENTTHGATVNNETTNLTSHEQYAELDGKRLNVDKLNGTTQHNEATAIAIQSLVDKKFSKFGDGIVGKAMKKFIAFVDPTKGQYKISKDMLNNVEIIAHETGHIIAQHLGLLGGHKHLSDYVPKKYNGIKDIYLNNLNRQLISLAVSSNGFSSYKPNIDTTTYGINEGIAEAFRLYLTDSTYFENNGMQETEDFINELMLNNKNIIDKQLLKRKINKIRKAIYRDKVDSRHHNKVLTDKQLKAANKVANDIMPSRFANIEGVDALAPIRYALEDAMVEYNNNHPNSPIENERDILERLMPYMLMRDVAGYKKNVEKENGKFYNIYKEMARGSKEDLTKEQNNKTIAKKEKEFDYKKQLFGMLLTALENNENLEQYNLLRSTGLTRKEIVALESKIKDIRKELKNTEEDIIIVNGEKIKVEDAESVIEETQKLIEEKTELLNNSYYFQKEIMSNLNDEIIDKEISKLESTEEGKKTLASIDETFKSMIINNIAHNIREHERAILLANADINDTIFMEWLDNINDVKITENDIIDMLGLGNYMKFVGQPATLKELITNIFEISKNTYNTKEQVDFTPLMESVLASELFRENYKYDRKINGSYSADFKRLIPITKDAVENKINEVYKYYTNEENKNNITVEENNKIKEHIKKIDLKNSSTAKNEDFVDYMICKRQLKLLQNNYSYFQNLRNSDRIDKMKELEDIIDTYESIYSNFEESSNKFYAQMNAFSQEYRKDFVSATVQDRLDNELIYDDDGNVIGSEDCYIPFNIIQGNVLGERKFKEHNSNKAIRGNYSNSTILRDWQEEVADMVEKNIKDKATNDARKSFFKTMSDLGVNYEKYDPKNALFSDLMAGDEELLKQYINKLAQVQRIVIEEIRDGKVNRDVFTAKLNEEYAKFQDLKLTNSNANNIITALKLVSYIRTFESMLGNYGADVFNINTIENNILDMASNKNVCGSIVNNLAPDSTDFVTVWSNGNKTTYIVTDNYVKDALLYHNYKINHIKLFTTFLSPFASVLRGGVSLAYQFFVNNMIRDTVHTASVSTAGHFVPVWGTYAGLATQLMAGIFKNEKAIRNIDAYEKSGGSLAGISSTSADKKAELNKIIVSDNTNAVRKVFANLYKGYLTGREISENATRIGNFIAIKKHMMEKYGFTEEEANIIASFKSRDITDWAMQGKNAILNDYISTVAFLRSTIVSNAYMIHEGKSNPKLFFRNLAISMACHATCAMLEAMLYKDDDDYKLLSDYIVDNYFVIKIPNTHKFIKIPLAFEVGKLGAVPFKRLIYGITNSRPNDIKNNLLSFINSYTLPISTVVSLGLQLRANKDSFSQRDIEPYWTRTGSSTTETKDRVNSTTANFLIDLSESKIGGIFNAVSPAQVGFVLDNLWGTTGADVVDLVDLVYTVTKNKLFKTNKNIGVLPSNMPNHNLDKFTTKETIYSSWYDKFKQAHSNMEKKFGSSKNILKRDYERMYHTKPTDLGIVEIIGALEGYKDINIINEHINNYNDLKERYDLMNKTLDGIKKQTEQFYKSEDDKERQKLRVEIARDSLLGLLNADYIKEKDIPKYVKNNKLVKY